MTHDTQVILFIVCFVIIPSAAWCISKRSIKVIWQGPLIAVGMTLILVAFILVMDFITKTFPWLLCVLVIIGLLLKLFGKKD